jgi:hypothetical protein
LRCRRNVFADLPFHYQWIDFPEGIAQGVQKHGFARGNQHLMKDDLP